MKRTLFLLFCLGFGRMVSPAQNGHSNHEKVFIRTDKTFYLVGETIWFKAWCVDSETHAPSSISTVLYAELINASGEAVVQEKIMLENGMGSGQFFISGEIAGGGYFLRSYTSWMRNFSPAEFYIQPLTILQPLSPAGDLPLYLSRSKEETARRKAELKIDLKPQYGNREKVTLAFTAPSGIPQEAVQNLSVSVYKYPGKTLVSDNKGLQQVSEEQTIKPAKPVTATSVVYIPELRSPVIQGKIMPRGNAVVPDFIHLIFPGSSSFFYTARPDSNRQFAVEVSPEIRTTDLLLWSEEVDISQFDIEIIPSFSAAPVENKYSAERGNEKFIPFFESLSVNTQVANAYLPFSNVRGVAGESVYPPASFFGQGDISYNLDDYIRFPTMEEVFIEYVRYVIKKKKKDSGEKFYLWDLYINSISISNTIYFPNPALTLIDGVPVGDLETIWNFDPLKISRIDMVNRKYYSGEKAFDGIICFHTYKGDLAGEKIPADVVQKTYKPIQTARTFFSPDYDLEEWKNSRIPDYRSLLYWNPGVSMYEGRGDCTFFTGDDTGSYRVEVTGFLPDGTFVSGATEFTVTGER